jgi:hypothetical protein
MTHHVNWLEVVGVILLICVVYGIIKLPGLLLRIAVQLLKDYALVWVVRHFTGAHYHGERITDATWFQHGTTTSRKYDHGGFMDRWEHKPRAHRALWRTGCTVVFAAFAYGMIADRRVTYTALVSMAVYVAVIMVFAIERTIRLRVHRRHVLNPIEKTLAVTLRLSRHAVRRMLHIDPENISDEGEIGYLEIPDGMTPGADQETVMARVIDAHLPVDSELDFRLQQQPRLAVIRAAQKPPGIVTWESMVAEMDKCNLGEVVLAVNGKKEPYKADLNDQEDPHWGFDCAPKYGKSNFLGVIMAQIFHQDPQAQLLAIDPKRSSLLDFTGSDHTPGKPLLRGVTLANDPRDPEAMWGVIQQARAIFERRSEKYELDRTRKFPCCLVYIDELNQFADIIRAFWNKLKFDDSRLPRNMRSGLAGPWPGWDDIFAILQMGRFVNMHIIVCSQDFRDDSFGGRGGRNYLGLKGMAGFNPSQWDKFMQTKPVPVMQNQTGRWILSNGTPPDEWVQTIFADAVHSRAAYDYAAKDRELFDDTDGDVTASDDTKVMSATDNKTHGLSYYLSSLPQPSVSHDAGTTDSRQVIPGEAAAAEYFGWKLTRFQTARRRQPVPGEFTRGRTPCWYEDDLLAWEASRPRSKNHLRSVPPADDGEVTDG